MYALQHCLEAKEDLVRKWQQSVLPQIIYIDDRRQWTVDHHHAKVSSIVYIYTNSHNNYLYRIELLLDAAPAWQWCITKVLHCSAIDKMCAVWVAAWNKSHACWYSIHDDLVSKYKVEVHWIVVHCEECTWYSIVVHNLEDVPARLKSCVMCMHSCKMVQYAWICGWLPTR